MLGSLARMYHKSENLSSGRRIQEVCPTGLSFALWSPTDTSVGCFTNGQRGSLSQFMSTSGWFAIVLSLASEKLALRLYSVETREMMERILGPFSFQRFVVLGFISTRTLPRLLAIQAVITCGALIGMLLCRWTGTPIESLGFYVSSVLSCLILIIILWVFILGRLLLFYPLPICRNGKCCGYKEYSWSTMSIYGRMQWGHYLYLRHHKKFIEIVAPEPSDSQFGEWIPITEANIRAYKRLSKFRNWIDDSDPIKF
jgi:hypothetical protein